MPLEEALAGVRRALKEARETIVKMVERGEYGVAIEALATTLERAFSRLGDVVMRSIEQLGEKIDKLHESVREQGKHIDRLTLDVQELRESVMEQGKHIDELTSDMQELRESVREQGEHIDELYKSIKEHSKQIDKLTLDVRELHESIRKQGEHIDRLTFDVRELRESIREQGKHIDKLHESVVELRKGLEEEGALRRSVEGRVGYLEGRMVEAELRMSLIFWCDRYGLGFEHLPPKPFRVDGVVIGERIVALVEIAKTGAEADIEQLLEGARIYERIRGERPNALVLFIYAERPSEELVRACEEHGILVENSPRRIARKLAELDRELAREAGQASARR